MLLTIFTPTYNRDYTLTRLYESLCHQTNQSFEWVIVDDGSTDDTEKMVITWQQENRISIIYKYKKNGGKPSAYNIGAKVANGDYFMCVDSDDYLKEDAVGEVLRRWEKDDSRLINNKRIIGQIYFRENDKGFFITKYKEKVKYATLLDFYRKYGLTGDAMLVYKSEVIRNHPFPIYSGEKFVPESYVLDQYDDEGLLHMNTKGLYICEYLPDGYSASIRKLNYDNPRGYEAFIKQRLKKDKSIINRFLDMIRYIAIKLVMREKKFFDCENKLLTFVSILPGWLFYRKVYYKYVKKR